MSENKSNLPQKLAAEALGTAFLLAAVVGSGIMGERLSQGNAALTLLVNSLATGAALIALIFAFCPISGAHFNPLVSLACTIRKQMSVRDFIFFVVAQLGGAVAGVAIAHLMFGEPIFSFSEHIRDGGGQILSEFVATLGLLAVILGCTKFTPSATPYAVGGYITAAYWFTSSTSFANPAVTLARSLTNSFSGICPANTPAFIGAQLAGAIVAVALFSWLVPQKSSDRIGS